MFDHELPVAAIPERSVVDIEGVTAVVQAIHCSEPRAGLITWDTDQGSYALAANRRLPVNLPAKPERSDPDAAAARPRRRPRRS